MRSREEINAYNRKYYLEHREQVLLRNKEKYKRRKELQDGYSREWHRNHAEEVAFKKNLRKEQMVIYKGGRRSACGIEYNGENGCIFDFHHIDPNEKEYRPSTLVSVTDWEKVKRELDKCVLVCANCHRLIHKKYKNGRAEEKGCRDSTNNKRNRET